MDSTRTCCQVGQGCSAGFASCHCAGCLFFFKKCLSWLSWSQLPQCRFDLTLAFFHLLYHNHRDHICFPQGRMKFVRPLYRDLYAWEEKRQQAIDTFKAHRWKTHFWSYIFVLIARFILMGVNLCLIVLKSFLNVQLPSSKIISPPGLSTWPCAPTWLQRTCIWSNLSLHSINMWWRNIQSCVLIW